VDLVVVLGGPIGAYEQEDYPFIADEIAILRARVAANRPTLAICLGAQILAQALGARVYAGTKEIGWAPLKLTEAGQRSVLRDIGRDATPVLHWHGDTFDLPDGADRLASTPECANQAFSLGATLAVQFHPEVGDALHRRGCSQWPEMVCGMAGAGGGPRPASPAARGGIVITFA